MRPSNVPTASTSSNTRNDGGTENTNGNPSPPRITFSNNSSFQGCRGAPNLRSSRAQFIVGPYGLGGNPVNGESFCSCPAVRQGRVRFLECTCGEEDCDSIEWGWDTQNKASASEISSDERIVKFHVNYSCGTAAVKGNQPMTNGQYFWEVKMITPVYGTDMMIGVGTVNVDLGAYRNQFCSLLGRDGESWGLSYMGQLQNKGKMKPYGPRFGQGSIIGIYLDMWHGTLEFYKNHRPLGIAIRGLTGKVLYPMVSSTAAQSGMKIIKARSFSTSLQFMCCRQIRKMIPAHMDICQAIQLPPGLRDFLCNNLNWLLRPSVILPDAKKSDKDENSTSSTSQTERQSQSFAGSEDETIMELRFSDSSNDSDTEIELNHARPPTPFLPSTAASDLFTSEIDPECIHNTSGRLLDVQKLCSNTETCNKTEPSHNSSCVNTMSNEESPCTSRKRDTEELFEDEDEPCSKRRRSIN